MIRSENGGLGRGLDEDGRILTMGDLRTLIGRYGFGIAALSEVEPFRVRASVYPRLGSSFHETPERSRQVLDSLRGAIETGRSIGVRIEIETVPVPVSDGSAYR